MSLRTLLPSLFRKDAPISPLRHLSRLPSTPGPPEQSEKLGPQCFQRTLLSHDTELLYCLGIGTEYCYVGNCSGLIQKYSLSSGDELMTFRGHTDIIRDLQTVSDQEEAVETLIYSVSRDKTLRGFDATTGAPTFPAITFRMHPECLTTGGANVFVGASDGVIHCHRQQDGDKVGVLRVHTCNVKDILAQGPFLYTCSLDGLAKCVDVTNMKLAAIFEGLAPLRCLATTTFTQQAGLESPFLLAGSSNGHLLGYDCRTSRCVYNLHGHSCAVLCITAQDHSVWTGSEDRSVKQWDLRLGKCTYTYSSGMDVVKGLHYDHRNRRVTAGCIDRWVFVWEEMDPELHMEKIDNDNEEVKFLSVAYDHFKKWAKHDSAGVQVLTPVLWKQCLNAMDLYNLKVIDHMFHWFDTSRDGEVEVAEVVTALENFFVHMQDETLKRAFDVFDSNGTGDISKVEAQLLLHKGNQSMALAGISKGMVQEVCSLLENGQMDYTLFKKNILARPKLLMLLLPVVLTSMAFAKGGVTPIPPTAEEEKTLRAKYEKKPVVTAPTPRKSSTSSRPGWKKRASIGSAVRV